MTIRDAYKIYTPLTFYRYFKFTIVRNPWDRLYSAFMFLKDGGMHEYDYKWSQLNLKYIPDFETFVKDGLTMKSIQSKIHFVPQVKFLINRRNKIGVNYIGRYEQLENSFNLIKRRINPNAELLYLNKSKKKRYYKDAYTPAMVSIVREYYKMDINILDYQF